jgi:hypothetical protein
VTGPSTLTEKIIAAHAAGEQDDELAVRDRVLVGAV